MGQSASAKIFYGILIYDEHNWSDNCDVFDDHYEMDVDSIINEFDASDVLELVYYGYQGGGHAIGIKLENIDTDWEPKNITKFLSDRADDYGWNDPVKAKVDKLKELVTALREKGFEIADPTWYLSASYG